LISKRVEKKKQKKILFKKLMITVIIFFAILIFGFIIIPSNFLYMTNVDIPPVSIEYTSQEYVTIIFLDKPIKLNIKYLRKDMNNYREFVEKIYYWINEKSSILFDNH
jgi:hypothetical protein